MDGGRSGKKKEDDAPPKTLIPLPLHRNATEPLHIKALTAVVTKFDMVGRKNLKTNI